MASGLAIEARGLFKSFDGKPAVRGIDIAVPPGSIYGILGPILEVPEVRFVKAAYRRPFKSHEKVEMDGGGRVTELSAKPLFNLFYPELTGFVQPLAGEFVADRELLSSIPFLTGYAVETGIMIDVLKMVGLDAMAQVDLGTRQNRHQSLADLSKMALEVLTAAERRTHGEVTPGALLIPTPDDFELEPPLTEERPPRAAR